MSTDPSNRRTIAVGLDDSEASWLALEEAIELSRQDQSILHIVSIQESTEASYNAAEVLASEKTSRQKLEHAQRNARKLAEDKGIMVETAISPGSSTSVLVQYVKQHNIDLLVIGETGHSSVWGSLLGTTAEKIVRQAPCSVLVVRKRPG